MVDYFHKGDDLFLRGMGVDRAKLPERAARLDVVLIGHEQPDSNRLDLPSQKRE
jgi:hypothetical protein